MGEIWGSKSNFLSWNSKNHQIYQKNLCFVVRTNLSSHLHQYPSTESLFFWHIWWFLEFQLKKLLFDPQISPILSSKSVKSDLKTPIFAVLWSDQTYVAISNNMKQYTLLIWQKWCDFYINNGPNRQFLMKKHRFSLWENQKNPKNFCKHDKNYP